MLVKNLLHRDTSRDCKSRAITVSVPFITKRRLGVPTVTLCFYGERLLWLSPHFDRYNTPNMLKCCFQTQSRLHDRETIHNLSVSKENDLQSLYLGCSVQHIIGKWSPTPWGNLKNNTAELGQIKTSAECYHPLMLSNTGTFPHVSAIGMCNGMKMLCYYTLVAVPFEVQQTLQQPRKNIQGWSTRARWQS